MKLRKRAKSGFTLVEVVISIVIIVLVIIPILNMLVISSKTQQKARQKQQATEIGQAEIEELDGNSSIVIDTSSAQYKFTDFDGKVFDISKKDDGVYEAHNTTDFNGYGVYLTFSPTDVNYKDNQDEVTAASNTNNYSDTLTFGNKCVSDENKTEYSIGDSVKDLNLDIEGETSGDKSIITGYVLKSNDGEIIDKRTKISKNLNKIEIVQGSDFNNSTNVNINIASNITSESGIDVVFIRKKNNDSNNNQQLILRCNVDDNFSGNISLIQLGADEVNKVLDQLYNVSIQIKDKNNNVIFEGKNTRNIKIS